MDKEKILIIIVFFSLFHSTYGQDKKIQIGLDATFIPQGRGIRSELANSYSILLGVKANYHLIQKEKWRYFFTAGFSINIDGQGAALTLFDLGLGAQYNFWTVKDKPFYASLSLGGLYIHETFSTTLIEGTMESTFNDFGYKANFGIGYYISQKCNVQINISQLNSQATTIGLTLFYNL